VPGAHRGVDGASWSDLRGQVVVSPTLVPSRRIARLQLLAQHSLSDRLPLDVLIELREGKRRLWRYQASSH
jgi:hypothetical protein